jgi:murein DD-endopeptidase MepM/ murein hydrolase activator NlpD
MYLTYPCDSRRVTSPFGPRNIGDGFHDGCDLGAIVPGVDGDNIYAAHDGQVARAYYSKSYGNCIIINGKGYSTLYAHLSLINVKQGQFVKQGQIIGHMGTTGLSTGTHLHFEYRRQEYDSNYFKSVDGRFLTSADPMPLLRERFLYPDISDRPTEAIQAIEWATSQGLLKGYPDGTFKPTEPVTREELAIILYRKSS